MITRNNILFESNRVTGSVSRMGMLYIPPAPFSSHATNVLLEDEAEKVHVPVMFTKAVLSWAPMTAALYARPIYEPEHAAVGAKSSGKAYPYVYAEFQQDPNGPVDCVAYDANTGALQGFRYNEYTEELEELEVNGEDLKDGVAVWLAILAVYSSVRSPAVSIEYIHHQIEDGCEDDAWQNVARLFKDIREMLLEDESLLHFGEAGDTTLGLLDLSRSLRGSIGPSPGNMITGEMKVFGSRESEELSFEDREVDPKEYEDIPWVRQYNDLSPEEQMLVPWIDKNHIVTDEEIDVLNDIKRTAHKGETRRISNILLVGSAGTGKTESVRFWGSVLKRPVVTQTMSAYTSEDDIRGTILMHLDDEEIESSSMSDEDKKVYKAILSCEDDSLMTDRVAEAMGLPTIAEAYFDPAGTIETLTGASDESADEFKARDALETVVSAEIKKVCAEAKTAKTDGGVHYRYIPSPIVKAIENGYLLEIQEPSNVIQQGVLTTLYDVLERASVGTLTLPHKTIRRHPDFMCVMTTNTDYPGCKPLSPALISRMQEQILLSDLSRETLVQRVLSRTDITDVGLASKIVDVYLAAKDKGEELGSMGEATPRSLYTFADAVGDGEDPLRAFKRFLLGAVTLNADDQADVLLAVEDFELFN